MHKFLRFVILFSYFCSTIGDADHTHGCSSRQRDKKT